MNTENIIRTLDIHNKTLIEVLIILEKLQERIEKLEAESDFYASEIKDIRSILCEHDLFHKDALVW